MPSFLNESNSYHQLTEVERSRSISNCEFPLNSRDWVGVACKIYTIVRGIAPLKFLVRDKDGITTFDKRLSLYACVLCFSLICVLLIYTIGLDKYIIVNIVFVKSSSLNVSYTNLELSAQLNGICILHPSAGAIKAHLNNVDLTPYCKLFPYIDSHFQQVFKCILVCNYLPLKIKKLAFLV